MTSKPASEEKLRGVPRADALPGELKYRPPCQEGKAGENPWITRLKQRLGRAGADKKTRAMQADLQRGGSP
jgi:hypothetical protein